MPKIRIRLFANLREYTKTKELELDGKNIRDILEILCKKFPGLEHLIFNGEEVRPYVNILLNGNVIEPGGLGTALHQDDELAIFPPVSGG